VSPPSFAELTQALHGRAPYRWQERAASELARHGWWPALRVPTGCGKTTLIDCWLHALSMAGPDRLGRRLVWVVDRRSVVDQVHAYAEKTLADLTAQDAPVEAQTVAAALRAIGGDLDPRVSLWRGGLDDEASMAMRRPLDPAGIAVIVSTVDQLGSRLLFRGYGLRVGSRSVHAGLLGLDTTVVLDEAHIAEPLRQTVDRVASIQAAAPASPRPSVRLCAVSATHEAEGAFELSEDDRAEKSIARRILASKQAQLVEHNDTRTLVKGVEDHAAAGARLIGVVLNTVATARSAFEALASVASQPLADRLLLIGPVRPLDRLDLFPAIPDPADSARRDRPFVVVATQTIEVGIDLDFDALVAACAPLDSLVQRFGRLDRHGERGHSRATVLAPPRKGCPVYGEATAATWDWLQHVAGDGPVDLGVDAVQAEIEDRGAPQPLPPVRTIRLLDQHVDALTVTDGTEDEGPAVELLLHGDRRTSAQVSIVWRELGDEPSDDQATTDLDLRPVHHDESITISLAACKRWLIGDRAGNLSDVESIADEEGQRDARARSRFAAWRIGPDDTVRRVTDPGALNAGDRVVVDASAGGLDGFGWAPASSVRVADLGSLAARGPRVVLEASAAGTIASELASGDLDADEAAGLLRDTILNALPGARDARPRFAERIARSVAMLTAGRASLLDDARVLVIGHNARTEHASGAQALVPLDGHQEAVAARVSKTAGAIAVPTELSVSLHRAARHHDEGKRDPRFQAWLRGGASAAVDALAKATYPYHPVRVRRLREAAGWPAGKRHELLSAIAVAHAWPEDRLAAWLVATHHGLNRPFPAAVPDDGEGDVAMIVDGDQVTVAGSATPPISEQLHALPELGEELGPWGLAFLEAILICADRGISAEEAGG
jgi:CRISPR-associated endonuclease/helicase Cas3